PLFAAFGPLDAVPGELDPSEPWAEAFATAPAPFGSGPAPPGIVPIDSGFAVGGVHRYYAFDASQAGGTVRVIVLDNSAGSLQATSPGQTVWLGRQLAEARGQGLDVVVIASLPLRGSDAQNAVARMLADAGVLAVFTTNPSQLNEVHMVPDDRSGAQIPEYEGASLSYQQTANNGVVWYDVSVDTVSHQVHVDAIPLIDSLSLKPLEGLDVARSFTLEFQAIARRPIGSLATTPANDSFPGYDGYVTIPAASCGSRPCITPTYSF